MHTNPGSLKLPSKFKSTVVGFSPLPASPPPTLLRKTLESFKWRVVELKRHQAKPHLIQEGERGKKKGKEQSPPRTQFINRVEKTQVSTGTLRHLADSPPLPISPLSFKQRLLKRPQWLDPDSE